MNKSHHSIKAHLTLATVSFTLLATIIIVSASLTQLQRRAKDLDALMGLTLDNEKKKRNSKDKTATFNHCLVDGLQKRNAGTQNQTIEDIIEYIEANLNLRITLNQTADKFGFNPNYLSQLFSKHMGCTFIGYVNAQKINKAKLLLLESDAKVYEIAEKLGFENAFYFSKVFKKYTGLSPREYTRRQIGGSE